MRVIFESGDLHVVVPAGRFTLRPDGAVVWHTPYSALTTHAGMLDDEVFVPGFHAGDAVDALALADGRVAIVVGGDAPRVDVVDRATGACVESVVLRGDGTRLPTLTPMESWSDAAVFEGHGARGIRLFPGLLVTAKESGHVLRVATGQLIRVPGAPENTVYAACIGDDLLIGMKWNGRHADLFLVGPGNELKARWPKQGDEEVRWGMPAPVVIGDHVVTYSDDGPHARQLALLKLPELDEVDHAPVDEWPADLATDGERFAAVAKGRLVLGRVAGGKLVIDERLTIQTLMKRAGVRPAARTSFATDDGAGTRTWVEGRIDKLAVDGEVAVVLGEDGSIRATHETLYEPLPPVAPNAGLVARMRAATRGLFDASGGRLVIRRRGELVLADRLTREELLAVPAAGPGMNGLAFADGLLWVIEEDDELILRFATPGSEPRILGRCRSEATMRELLLARSGDAVAWFELARVDNAYRFTLARWAGGDVTRTPLPRMIRALALSAGTAYVIAAEHIQRVDPGGALIPLTTTALRNVVVHEQKAFCVEPTSTSGGVLYPAKLWRIDLSNGATALLSTATVGAISCVGIQAGRLWWLEARDAGMSFFKLGEDENASAICSLLL